MKVSEFGEVAEVCRGLWSLKVVGGKDRDVSLRAPWKPGDFNWLGWSLVVLGLFYG